MSLDFVSRRSPVLARRGMVAASQPLAAMAGVRILMQGGNAADAAIAVAAALNVTEPTSTGLGGDFFALYYDAQTRAVTALNGSGRAPSALTLDRVQSENLVSPEHQFTDPFSAHCVTVPGACAGWCDLIERHGTLPMSQILAPAIALAEEGFPVAPTTAYFWQRSEGKLHAASGGQALLIHGHAPRAGQVFHNPGLARTMRAIAQGGKDAYYKGEIAKSIAQVVQASGGVMTSEDLVAHESTWDTPISTTYRDVRAWECPPNGQGLAVLIALNIIEAIDVKYHAPMSVERLHLLIEAMRLSFADTSWYVADPKFVPAPLDRLLSKDYAAQRMRLMHPHRATLDTKHGAPVAGSDTVYFCVVDDQGNGASVINSNYMGFGTGIVPEGWGFSLQNRGANFSLDPAHPNALAPGKRPYHTIIPGMITREADGSLYAPFGVMGGFMQPQGHVQVVVGIIDDDLDPQSALDRPRFCLSEASPQSAVQMEEGIPKETMDELARMGHRVIPVAGYARATFGRGQIIVRQSDGTLWGGSDPRADGCAVGY